MDLRKTRKNPSLSRWILLSVILASNVLDVADAQARLMFPIGRSSRWREEWDAPRNFEDHLVNCGGTYMEHFEVDLMCGVCGDNLTMIEGEHVYMANHSYPNEAGGMYAHGEISATFNVSDQIVAVVEIMASRKGYIEFHVCPNNNFSAPATVECMNDHPLQPLNGTVIGSKWYVPETDKNAHGYYYIPLQLPERLRCAQCVFRMRWRTGSNWGEEGSNYGLGYGAQEYFFACSDIQIGEGFTQEELRRMYTVDPTRRGYNRNPYKAYKEKSYLASGTHVYDKTTRKPSTSYGRIGGATKAVTLQPEPRNTGMQTDLVPDRQTKEYDKDKSAYTPAALVPGENHRQEPTDKSSSRETLRPGPKVTASPGGASTQPSASPLRTTLASGSDRPETWRPEVQKENSTDGVTVGYGNGKSEYSTTTVASELNKTPLTDKADQRPLVASGTTNVVAPLSTETGGLDDEIITSKPQAGDNISVSQGSSVKYEKGNGDYTKTFRPSQFRTESSGNSSIQTGVGGENGAMGGNRTAAKTGRPSEYDKDKGIHVPTAGVVESSKVSETEKPSSNSVTGTTVLGSSKSARKSQMERATVTPAPPSPDGQPKSVVTGYNIDKSEYTPTVAGTRATQQPQTDKSSNGVSDSQTGKMSISKATNTLEQANGQSGSGTVLPVEASPVNSTTTANTVVVTGDQRSRSVSVTISARSGEKSTVSKTGQEQKGIATHVPSSVGKKYSSPGVTLYPGHSEEVYRMKTTDYGQTGGFTESLPSERNQGERETGAPTSEAGLPGKQTSDYNPVPTRPAGATSPKSVRVEMTTITSKSPDKPKSGELPSASTSIAQNTYVSHSYNESEAVYSRISTRGVYGEDKGLETSRPNLETEKEQTGSYPPISGYRVDGSTRTASQGDTTIKPSSSKVGENEHITTGSYHNGEGQTNYYTNDRMGNTEEIYTDGKSPVISNTKSQIASSEYSTMSPAGKNVVNGPNVQNPHPGTSFTKTPESFQSSPDMLGSGTEVLSTESQVITAGPTGAIDSNGVKTTGLANIPLSTKGTATTKPPAHTMLSLPPPPQTKFIIPFSTRIVTTRVVIRKDQSEGKGYNPSSDEKTKSYTPDEYQSNQTTAPSGEERQKTTPDVTEGSGRPGAVERTVEPAETIASPATQTGQTNIERLPGPKATPSPPGQGGKTEILSTESPIYFTNQGTYINTQPTSLPKTGEKGSLEVPGPVSSNSPEPNGDKGYGKRQGSISYTEQRNGIVNSTSDGGLPVSTPAATSTNASISGPRYQTIYPIPEGGDTTAPPQLGRVYGTTYEGERAIIIPATQDPSVREGAQQATTQSSINPLLRGPSDSAKEEYEGSTDYSKDKETGTSYGLSETTPSARKTGDNSLINVAQVTNTPGKGQETAGSTGGDSSNAKAGQGVTSSGAISGQTRKSAGEGSSHAPVGQGVTSSGFGENSAKTPETAGKIGVSSSDGEVTVVPKYRPDEISQRNKTIYAVKGDGQTSSYENKTSASPPVTEDRVISPEIFVDNKQESVATKLPTQARGSVAPERIPVTSFPTQGPETESGRRQIQPTRVSERGGQNAGSVTGISTRSPGQGTQSTISVRALGSGQNTGSHQSTSRPVHGRTSEAQVQTTTAPAGSGQLATSQTTPSGEITGSPSLVGINATHSSTPRRVGQATPSPPPSNIPNTRLQSTQAPRPESGQNLTPRPSATPRPGTFTPFQRDETSPSRKDDQVVTYKPTGYEPGVDGVNPSVIAVTNGPNNTQVHKPSINARQGPVPVEEPKLSSKDKPYPASGEVSLIQSISECNAISVYLHIKGSRQWCLNNCSKGFCPDFLCNEWCIAMKAAYSTKYRRKP